MMLEAENEMKKYLSNKTLAWLYDEVYHKKLSKNAEEDMLEWFDRG